MQIRVLFDKKAQDTNLKIGWGLSLLVEGKILFDAGENGDWLINNIKELKIEISKLEAVVISHDHWDHTGGLREVLNRKKGLKVYACPGFNREFKEKVKILGAELIELDNLTEIAKNIYVSGEIPGVYNEQHLPEQALILKTDNGLSVLTGCAHPGIIKILEKVKAEFPKQKLYSVCGGFHLGGTDRRTIEIIAEKFKEMGVEKTGPTHCSGGEAEEIFKKKYGDNFITVKVGQTIEV